MDPRKDMLRRVYLVFAGMCLFALAIVWQIIRLQFVEGNYWRSRADSLTTAYRTIEAVRGNIFAADGSLLATSVPIYEIRFDAGSPAIKNELFREQVDSLALCLSELFKDKSPAQYKTELVRARKNKVRYYLLNRNVTHPQLRQLRTFPIFRAGRYKGGMIVIQKNRRERPFRMLAARTIGFQRDGIISVGLEGAFDPYLKGITGQRLMQKVSGNAWVPVNEINEIEPKDGSDIVTTLDVNIQDVAESALYEQLSTHNASHGCVVVMEVQTGEIKAIANLGKDSSGRYTEAYNYAVGESTEPGSTFKLASLVAAMEDGYVDTSDIVDTEKGKVRYYDRTMSDSHEGGYGKISVKRAFEVSSNVGISKIITRYYAKNPKAFVDRIVSMGLADPVGLQIKGEARPVVKQPGSRNWWGTTLPWMSIGYEVRQTPMQTLVFYNAIANDGIMVRPLFVKEIRNKGQVTKSFRTSVKNPAVCSPSTLRKVRAMLEGVVENGTAGNLKDSPFRIAGKTGTAQIAKGQGGYGYAGEKTYLASFAGYFPAEKPKYSCIIVVSSPSRGVYYGNVIAGNVFKEIAAKIYSLRLEMQENVAPLLAAADDVVPVAKHGYREDIEKVQMAINADVGVGKQQTEFVGFMGNGKSRKPVEMNVPDNAIPNVVGMGLRDAVFLLESRGYTVKAIGRGTVRRQMRNAGQQNHIIIELS